MRAWFLTHGIPADYSREHSAVKQIQAEFARRFNENRSETGFGDNTLPSALPFHGGHLRWKLLVQRGTGQLQLLGDMSVVNAIV